MASVLNIGERLEEVVALCPSVKKIVDIGCDHGLVTAELILEDKTEMVIATEKSEKCLSKAINLAQTINIAPFISFRVGDGFEPITKYDKVKFAVIAGMGGDEIIKILEKKPKKLYDFVLQPMKDAPLLREWLVSHKFKILVDKLVKEGDKFYDVISVTKGKDKLADLEVLFGRTNFKENYEVLYEFLTIKQQQLADLQAKAGMLSSAKQQEYDNVCMAISLFEEQLGAEQPQE